MQECIEDKKLPGMEIVFQRQILNMFNEHLDFIKRVMKKTDSQAREFSANEWSEIDRLIQSDDYQTLWELLDKK